MHTLRVAGAAEVWWRFFILGWIAFGGPAAHVGYFRRVFVSRLRWLDDASFGRLLALSHFLPGPGSSQLGFAIGLRRAGLAGGLAAFVGFTTPAFLLMFSLAAFSIGKAEYHAGFTGLLAGLKLLAVLVVLDAVIGMYRNFCRNRAASTLCCASACLMLLWSGFPAQFVALAVGAAVGTLLLPSAKAGVVSDGTIRWIPLILFGMLFMSLPVLRHMGPWQSLFADFYQTGALVFGGGHVVMPLLQSSVGGEMTADQFLLGYATVQGIPGPMFSLSAYLGALLMPDASLSAALLALLAIFAPGLLLMLGLLNAWESLASRSRIAGAVHGLNASVVGLLAAALYDPLFVNAVVDGKSVVMLLIGGLVFWRFRISVVWLVPGFALTGLLLGVTGLL